MFPFVQKDRNGLRLSLHVQPGASNAGFAGVHDDALKLRIQARAQDGAANKAVCEFLSHEFELPKSSIKIISGQSSRKKIVLLEGDANVLENLLEKIVRSFSS